MPAIISMILPFLTAGIEPLVKLALGKVAVGRRTIEAVRSVQGFSLWAAVLSLLGSVDFWVSVLPGLNEFVQTYFSETMVGAGVAVFLSVIFEGLRRVTTGPIR